jgi:hypothetical protein
LFEKKEMGLIHIDSMADAIGPEIPDVESFFLFGVERISDCRLG